MRWVYGLLPLVFACGSKKEAPPPSTGTASAAPIAIVVDAPTTIDAHVVTSPIELLHAYGGSLTVSSHVKNNTIKPEHLVDHDFNTAWNSQTGELAGAWVDVFTWGSNIHELRITVGHTGKGPKGEDYFTMNPRITKVSVIADGKPVVTVGLDPNSRELQAIKLPAPVRGTVRLRVEEVTMGTKTRWREVCISEIEAWGIPLPDTKPKAGTPVVSVFQSDLPKAARIEPGKSVDVFAYCDALLKPMMKDFKARGGASLEDPGPDCDPVRDETKLDTAPWQSVALWRLASNSAHGPMECQLYANTTAGTFFIGPGHMCGPWDDDGLRLDEATVEDVIPGGDPELVVRYVSSRGDTPVHLYVCRVAFDAVQCTKPYDIQSPDFKVSPRFAKGTLHLDPVEGKPPAEFSGPQALNFDH
jgi:hypothetical protein